MILVETNNNPAYNISLSVSARPNENTTPSFNKTSMMEIQAYTDIRSCDIIKALYGIDKLETTNVKIENW